MPKSRTSINRRIKLENRRKKKLRNQTYTLNVKGKLILDIINGKTPSNVLSPAAAREMLFYAKNRVRSIYLKSFDLEKYYESSKVSNLFAKYQ